MNAGLLAVGICAALAALLRKTTAEVLDAVMVEEIQIELGAMQEAA